MDVNKQLKRVSSQNLQDAFFVLWRQLLPKLLVHEALSCLCMRP
jgi:hypothetical protein